LPGKSGHFSADFTPKNASFATHFGGCKGISDIFSEHQVKGKCNALALFGQTAIALQRAHAG